MKAIERIAGYACEVNEEQWRELVKVADEVGVKVGPISRDRGTISGACPIAYLGQVSRRIVTSKYLGDLTLIAYPDFLAKLKGEDKWEPKNGEEVEALCGGYWDVCKFIGMNNGRYVCIDSLDSLYAEAKEVRPLRPTITRAEAEQKLKELGVIARIVD